MYAIRSYYAEIAEALGYEIVHHRLELYVRKKASVEPHD